MPTRYRSSLTRFITMPSVMTIPLPPSSVNIRNHKIQAAEKRQCVGQQHSPRALLKQAQVRKTRRAELEPVGVLGTIADRAHSKTAARGFHVEIAVPFGG